MFAMLKGKPCKIISITTSKTGKHGHAKANITGLDIFTGKKYMDISPTSHTMTQPVVKNTSYSLCDIDDDGMASLMTDEGEMKEDVRFPDQDSPDSTLGDRIRAEFDADKEVFCVVTAAMGQEAITGYKVGTE